MTKITLNDLAHSNIKLRAKESLYDMIRGDIYEVVYPDWNNDDCFSIKSLTNDNYCQIVETQTEYQKRVMVEYEYPVIEWKDFFKYFDILEE